MVAGRFGQALRKMTPGTLAGRARSATPVAARRSTRPRRRLSYRTAALLPTFIGSGIHLYGVGITGPGCPTSLGDLNPVGTYCMGLTSGGTRILWFDPDSLRVLEATFPDLTPVGTSSTTWPDIRGDGFPSPFSNFVVDDRHNLYLWDYPPPGYSGVAGFNGWWFRIAYPSLAVTPLFHEPDDGRIYCIGYNPVDGLIYEKFMATSVSHAGALYQVDLTTGARTQMPNTSVAGGGDMCAFTPDGAVWFNEGDGDSAHNPSHGVYRWTVAGLNLADNVGVAGDACPVPLGDNSVLVRRASDGTVLRIAPDMTVTASACDLHGGTARVASARR